MSNQTHDLCRYCGSKTLCDDLNDNDGVCNDCYVYDCPYCHGQILRDELNDKSTCGYCFPDNLE